MDLFLTPRAAEQHDTELIIMPPEGDKHGHQTVAGLRALLDGYPFSITVEDAAQGGLRVIIAREKQKASSSRVEQAWATYYGGKRSSFPRIGWLFLLAAGVTMLLSAGHSIPGLSDFLQALNGATGR